MLSEGEESQPNTTHVPKVQAGGRQSRELTLPEGQCGQFMRLESHYGTGLVHLGKTRWNQ